MLVRVGTNPTAYAFRISLCFSALSNEGIRDILRKSYREAVSYIPLIPQNPSNIRYIEIICKV
jgi:hypothetical protein